MATHRLAELRKAARLTQPELAARAHVSKETVSNIERGLSEPGVTVAMDLARALGTTVEEIFGDHATPMTPPPLGLHLGFSVTLDPADIVLVFNEATEAGFADVGEYIRHRLLDPTS